MDVLAQQLRQGSLLRIAGAPIGFDAIVLAEAARAALDPVLFVASNDLRLSQVSEAVSFFAPDVRCIEIPAWDCLPYDRISPNPEIVSRRISALARLAVPGHVRSPKLILTTISSILQRIPPPSLFANNAITIRPGARFDPADLMQALLRLGYARAEMVTEPGEYAARGGIIDVFPTGMSQPVRIDFFGDDIESIRVFFAGTQRTTRTLEGCRILATSEIILDEAAIARFRSAYRELFGVVRGDDPLYAAVSAGRRLSGMEHWLPLFHDRLTNLFEVLPRSSVVLDAGADVARDDRLELIADYYNSRLAWQDRPGVDVAGPYRPVPLDGMFLTATEWDTAIAGRPAGMLESYAAEPGIDVVDMGGRPGTTFAEARQRPDENVFDALRQRIEKLQGEGRRVIVAAVSTGSRERLTALVTEHGIHGAHPVDDGRAGASAPVNQVSMAVLALERGFVAPGLAVITEQDILGDRLIRRPRRRTRAEDFLREASALTAGDLVVHLDHGIGRFDALETIEVSGAPHDCLRILYAGDDRLYLPVENIEMLTRYGSDSESATLDRLGSASWQSRKAKLKARIREMADELIAVAATRAVKEGDAITPPVGLYDEFCARFPYVETDDQARAIGDVLGDLAAGKPADRLICGDVGFGKTEVALRAAFVTALEGKQVAVVVPTTLLCRQHARTFKQRFEGYPVRIEELSRLVTAAAAKGIKADLSAGRIDIIIGTHALLARDVRFRDLGLLVIDEEQHFGVIHKEQLKKLKADVHVLTLSATPIPRTLQLALSGVKEMSLIATPPVDRLAIRTYAMEFDPVTVREAILRERARGGQTFYVCPRIEDLDGVAATLAELVPEVSVVRAHGRMAPKDLESAVTGFYEKRFDVLLATNIIESGLDMPAVNTIIIHRADQFGLAQLYQLRGRVGRGKIRAYAYLTLPPKKKLTPAAQKRLQVMQALDALGAGFQIASHDLDIRGAGNLLGDEQSGHIREVGIELYQQMLEEAVAEARGASDEAAAHEDWSPQIALGVGVLIPEAFVPDLNIRLGLYRRLADARSPGEIDAFAAELIDRFGPLPEEVENLLAVMQVKGLCRTAGVERIEAGPKGAVISFHNLSFSNPAGLVELITRNAGTLKLRPDQRLVYRRAWDTGRERLAGVRKVMTELAAVATGRPLKKAASGR